MKEIPKKNNFKTPPDYFESLTDRILQRLDDEDTKGLPKKEGFTVPKGYFEGVEKDILDKALGRETPVVRLGRFRPFLYAAAAVAVLFVLVIGLNRNSGDTLSFDDLAQAEIASYIESRDLELSSYEIAEVIPVTQLEIDDFMDTAVDEEQILNYLEDSIDDLDEFNFDTHEEFQ
jgi:hypothetical protein